MSLRRLFHRLVSRRVPALLALATILAGCIPFRPVPLPQAAPPFEQTPRNVAEQVRNVTRTTVVRHAWRSGQPLSVHGVVYGIEDGLLQDLGLELTGPADADAVGQLVVGLDGD